MSVQLKYPKLLLKCYITGIVEHEIETMNLVTDIYYKLHLYTFILLDVEEETIT